MIVQREVAARSFAVGDIAAGRLVVLLAETRLAAVHIRAAVVLLALAV